jgi:hypothetical protein
MLITDQVATAPCTDPIQVRFLLLRQSSLQLLLRGQAVYFGHDGADEGFRAQLLMNREKGYGAVIMVTSDNGPRSFRSRRRDSMNTPDAFGSILIGFLRSHERTES